MNYIATRKDFSKETKREALRLSGGLCVAEGPAFKLKDGVRCNRNLAYGVQFDHRDALRNNDVSLANCQPLCPECHKIKTAKDVAIHAKTRDIADKHNGIKKRKKPWPSRKFNARWVDNTKYIGEADHDT